MKVLVIHEPAFIRHDLSVALEQLDSELRLFEAADVREALQVAQAHTDLSLTLFQLPQPGATGFDDLQCFLARTAPLPVIVISASANPADITRALDCGAVGFIPTSYSTPVMIGAMRLVLAGGVYIPEAVRHAPNAAHIGAAAAQTFTGYRDVGLTERQAQVLALLIEGKPNKLICRDLHLAEGTVKIHVTAILKALKVTNRTQAVLAVNRLGLQLPATH